MNFLRNSLTQVLAFQATQSHKPLRKWKIFKGDIVSVISGPEKGKTGKILRVFRQDETVLVHGVNWVKKTSPITTNKYVKGEEYEEHVPIASHKVNLYDPVARKPSRTSIGYLENGDMVRICKKSGAIIPKPDNKPKSYFERNKFKKVGPLDTLADKAHERTYHGEDFEKIQEDFSQYIQEKQAVEELLVFKK